jgi:hypothetical protein
MACAEGTLKSGPLYLSRLPGEGPQRPIEPCTNFWTCDDIKLGNGQYAAPIADDGTVVPNDIKVTVRNGGAQPVTNVYVQVWICDYNVGIGPAGGIASAGGKSGLGPRFLGNLAAGASREITVRWYATFADRVRNPDGHHCIIANAYGDAPDTGVFIPSNATQDVIFICCDSHHGWRNLVAKPISKKLIVEGDDRFELGFLLGNPTRNDLEGLITVTEVPMGFGIVERNHLLDLGLVEWTDPRLDPVCTRLVLAGEGEFPPGKSVVVAGTDRRMADLGMEGGVGAGREIPFRIGPDDQVPMRVTGVFDRDTEPGEVFVFDVVQHDAKGNVLSGARMLAAVGR